MTAPVVVNSRGNTKCSTIGHAWDETMDSTWRSEMGIPLTLLCQRCGDQRWDVIDPSNGDVISRRYVKAEGYQGYAKGERPSRSEFRRMLLASKIEANRKKRSK
jgi:hypothetical protein